MLRVDFQGEHLHIDEENRQHRREVDSISDENEEARELLHVVRGRLSFAPFRRLRRPSFLLVIVIVVVVWWLRVVGLVWTV